MHFTDDSPAPSSADDEPERACADHSVSGVTRQANFGSCAEFLAACAMRNRATPKHDTTCVVFSSRRCGESHLKSANSERELAALARSFGGRKTPFDRDHPVTLALSTFTELDLIADRMSHQRAPYRRLKRDH